MIKDYGNSRTGTYVSGCIERISLSRGRGDQRTGVTKQWKDLTVLTSTCVCLVLQLLSQQQCIAKDRGQGEAENDLLRCESTGPKGTGDRVTFRQSGDALHIVVTCRRGIGGAKLFRNKGQLPAKIIVELHHFRSLECFSLSSGHKRIETSLKTAPATRGRESAREDGEQEHPLQARIEIAQKRDKIVVTVPLKDFKWNVNEALISWIDAYR